MWTRERKLTYPSPQGVRGGGGKEAAPCFLVLCSSSPTQSNQTQSLSTEQPTVCWLVSEFGTYRWGVKTKFLSLLILNEEQVRFSTNSCIHPFSRGLGSQHNFMVVVAGVETILRTLVKKVPPVSPECPLEWDLVNTAGRGHFSQWKFINVFLSAAVINVAISVRSRGASAGLPPDAGGGDAGQRYGGVLSVVRKHELTPGFLQVTEIALAPWRQA